jgi:hypothetical protein
MEVESMQLHQSEIDDFEDILRQRNLSPKDFKLAVSLTDDVVVRSRSTGAEIRYRRDAISGPSSSPFVGWVEELARDLDSGRFA